MRTIRRIVLASTWGAVGPISVALAIVLFWGEWGNRGQHLDEFTVNLVMNVLNAWPFLVFEGVLGIAYGASRSVAWAQGSLRNLAPSAVIWGAIGLPFLVQAAERRAFDSGMGDLLGEGSFLVEMLLLTLTYLAHIGGGAIAEFQVDYFLRLEHRRYE